MDFIQPMFPYIVWSELSNLALLLLRTVAATMFVTSGWLHIAKVRERAESIELSVWATCALGFIELFAGIGVAIGLLTELSAFLLAGVMVGAIGFKAFKWRTGFFGKQNNGWYYELLLLAALGTILTVGAGKYALDAFVL